MDVARLFVVRLCYHLPLLLLGIACGGGVEPDKTADHVARVDIEPTALTLFVGDSAQLSAISKRSDGSVVSGQTVQWASADGSIASVNAVGWVFGRAAGITGASATSGQATANASITVRARPRVILGPRSVTLTAIGAVDPRTQSITVINALASPTTPPTRWKIGTITYAPGQPTGWLTASFDFSGTDILLDAVHGTLGRGTYTATFQVSALNDAEYLPDTATVNLVVKPIFSLTVSGAGNGSGQVTSSPLSSTGDLTCNVATGVASGRCSAAYIDGTTVTLTATPAAGSTFSGWSGACSGTGACVISITDNATVSASFIQ
jgi:hypothetical protein